MSRFWLFFGLLALLAGCQAPAAAPGPGAQGCPVFPPDHVWNTRVDRLPVHPNSAAWIAAIGAGRPLHPDFGSGTWQGQKIGIPYNLAGRATPRHSLTFDYADESDPGPYPIPPNARVEEGSDHHLLVVDTDACKLYELFNFRRSGGGYAAGSGAIFDLRGYALRPDGWTSADAAGLPIFPGLVRYDEVAAGAIRHALRFTAPYTSARHLWPARHHAATGDASDPPMGMRVRLRADFDTAGFSPEVRVILEALKTYGMILADNGGRWFLSGAPDERWDNDVLVGELGRVTGADFEVVDTRSLMVDPDSGRARQR